MKNNSGVTMIALIVTLIIISILTSITVKIGTKEIKDAELQDLVTNMLLIQAKTKIGVEQVIFETANITGEDEIKKIKEENLLGKLTSETQNFSFNGSLGVDTSKEWYALNDDDLKQIGITQFDTTKEDGNGNYYFIYNYDKNLNIEVVYTGGYRDSNGTMYYKLSDLIALQGS